MDNEIYIHETADIHPKAHIGEGTKIYQNVIVTSAAKIGPHCVIGANAFIDGVVGAYSKVGNGVCVFQGIVLGENVFVSHGVSFANVTIPRTYRPIPREGYKQTVICEGATLEINATIAPGVVIGKGAIVGMGSVVLEDVPPKVLARGNPAQVSLKSINYKRKLYEQRDSR